MKKALSLAIMLATGMFALGCKKSGDDATGPAQTNVVYNYTYDKREVFIDDASIDLKDLDQKINELSEKVTTAGKAILAAAQPKLDDLRKQRLALATKLDALKTARETNWDALKSDYQKAQSQITVSLKESWNLVQTNSGS